jgi:Zn-dependent metalloprotease
MKTGRVAGCLAALLLLSVAPFLVDPCFALDRSAAQALERLSASASIRVSPRTGLARFVRVIGRPGIATDAAAVTPEARALAFVTQHGAAFGLRGADEVSLARPPWKDLLGMEHVRLLQTHEGLPVTGAEIVIHLRDGDVTVVNGRTVAAGELAGVPRTPLSPAEAAQQAARTLVEERDLVVSKVLRPRLELFNQGLLDGRPSPTRLSWFVAVQAPAVLEYVWVDARTGEVLLHFNQAPQARRRRVYTAQNAYQLPGVLLRKEGEPEVSDPEANAAYDFAGDTYVYFRDHHGRDSIDDAGQPLVLSIHYGDELVYGGVSFWSTSEEQAVFADDMALADDFVAHEITHGLIQHTADLFSYGQPGALNESFADIFGETVDLLNQAGTDTPAVRWLLGEDWSAGGDMADPNAYWQPGKVSDPYISCVEDVHVNSGILDHAYALMVDGGDYNGHTIAGIGLTKAGQVMYRALTTYLTQTSDFGDAEIAINQSCSDLAATGALLGSDCDSVATALVAVELSDPWPCFWPTLGISKTGSGSGTVVSHPDGIDCGLACESSFHIGWVNLSATPETGSVFAGWGGDCSGSGGSSCRLRLTEDTVVPAQFDPAGTTYTLSVATAGPGTVTTSPAGIDCGGDCEETYPSGTTVDLAWAAPPAYGLCEWGGGCSGSESCRVTLNGAKDVTATFGLTPFIREQSLSAVSADAAAWGDYDNDGDLDLVVCGGTAPTLYRNDGGTLVDIGIGLPAALAQGRPHWADYDNDGDLDLLLASGITRLFRNDGNSFYRLTREIAPLANVSASAGAAWGDYDGDGDLDLVVAGYQLLGPKTYLFRNDDGVLVDTDTPLVGLYGGDLAWGDYDNDGRIDLVTSGMRQGRPPLEPDEPTTILYHNTGAGLVDAEAGLAGAAAGSLAWADYDADGDLDLAMVGSDSLIVSVATGFAKVYRNDSGTFVDVGAPLLGVTYGRVAWGDYDADGDPDLLITGYASNGESSTRLYSNDAGTFSEACIGLPDVAGDGGEWGDYDGDGRLDLSLLGHDSRVLYSSYTEIHRNVSPQANTPPQAPTDPFAVVDGQDVELGWTPASDAETPSGGLSYNVRVGTTPGGSEIVSASAEAATGRRRVALLGNAGSAGFMRLGLPFGRYYWAVQAIDSSYAGSPFSEETEFWIGPIVGSQTASAVGERTAHLEATVTPQGFEAVVHFEYGKTTAYGKTTPEQAVGSGTSEVSVAADLEGLAVCTVYHFRAVAVTAGSTVPGPDATFQTSGCPVVQFSAASYSNGEGARTASLVVRRVGLLDRRVKVGYATVGGTASEGTDYKATSGVLTLLPGQTSGTFAIPIVNDTLVENEETVEVALSSPEGATLGPLSAATLTIQDNDSGGVIQFTTSALLVREGVASRLVIVSRQGGGASGVTADYASVGGTATVGEDYRAVLGTLTFGAGQSRLSFVVPIVNDSQDESDETVLFELTNAKGGATLGATTSTTLTIRDDDAP